MGRRPDKVIRLTLEGVVYRAALWWHEDNDGHRIFYPPVMEVLVRDDQRWMKLADEDMTTEHTERKLATQGIALSWIAEEQAKERERLEEKHCRQKRIVKDGNIIDITSLVRKVNFKRGQSK